MPTLLELQRSFGQCLLHQPDKDLSSVIVEQGFAGKDRLEIYRNTSIGVMVGALRLAFVAVQHVLGPEFFEAAVRMFVAQSPPRSSWLDEYGADFPEFLAQLPQAASVPYVSDLARFEWKVNLALHATDAIAFDVAHLAGLNERQLSALCLHAHPAAHLIHCDFPADTIWHAVLARDENAMAAIDLADGPVALLVQRTATGIDVMRLNAIQWRVAEALFLGQTLGSAMACAPGPDTHAALAALLASGCFATFSFTDQSSKR